MNKFYEKVWNMKNSVVKNLQKLGDYIQFTTPLGFILWVALITGDIYTGRIFTLSFICAMSIYLLLNALFNNPRPSQTDDITNPDLDLDWSPKEGNSFPSGHTMAAMTGGVFWLEMGIPLGIIGIILGSICGFSRLAAQAHWMRDVLTSSLVSVIIYIIAKVLFL